MKRRLVLFDIDGTILLSGGAGRRAITTALSEAVGDVGAFSGIRFDGKTDPQIVGELLVAAGHEQPHDEARVAELCERYVTLLEQELSGPATGTVVMPGVPELLDRLEREDSVVLGLLTGNLARGARIKLAAAGISPERFRVGAFGSDSAHRPELPAVAARRAEPYFGRVPSGQEIVIIGDTPADIYCGAGIGARALGVATGGYGVDALSACAPHAVFPHLSDTAAVLTAILE